MKAFGYEIIQLFFDVAEVEPLLATLGDPSASVRIAGLRALVRLPLSQDAWLRVAGYISGFFSQSAANAHGAQATAELEEVIQAAAHVPLLSMRQRLHDLVKSGSPAERSWTAQSL